MLRGGLRGAGRPGGPRLGVESGGGRRGAPPWTPASLPSSQIYLWLRGDLGATSLLAPDQSGRGQNFAQGNTDQQPLAGVSGINGQSCWQFNAAHSQNLDIAALTLPTTDMEIVFVASLTNPPGFASLGQIADPTGLSVYDSTGIFLGWGSSTRRTCGVPITSIASPHILTVQATSTFWTCYLNGQLQATFASNTMPASGLVASVGGQPGWFFQTGPLAEVLITRLLSTATRAQLKAYLELRYGIVLGSAWS